VLAKEYLGSNSTIAKWRLWRYSSNRDCRGSYSIFWSFIWRAVWWPTTLRIDIVIVEAKTRLFGLVLTAQQANGAGVSHMGGCSWRGGRIDGSNVSCGSRCWWILRSSCIADSRLASDSGSAGVFKGKQRRLRVDGVSIPKGSYSIFWFFIWRAVWWPALSRIAIRTVEARSSGSRSSCGILKAAALAYQRERWQSKTRTIWKRYWHV